MKILFFCNLVPSKLGAYEWWLVCFARFLKARGDTFVLAIPGQPHVDLMRDLDEADVSIVSMDPWTDAQGGEYAWAFVGPALRHLRRFKPDIAVVNYGNELPSAVTALLATCTGLGKVRWIWQQHQQVCDPSTLTAKVSAIRLLGLFFDQFIAVYDGGRESLLKRGLPSRRVDVVYNGIRDHQRSRAAGWLRGELDLSDDTVILVNTGWLIPRKRVDFVLKAFAAMREKVDVPVALVIVGEGPEDAVLKTQSQSLGIAGDVRFLGMRNDVRELLCEADVLVHAALAETCTYVISEAMSVEVPCVVTEAGASREQIVSGETGYVVARDDHDGFVSHLSTLVSAPGTRKTYGAAARQRWEARYTVDAAALKYYEICQRVLSA